MKKTILTIVGTALIAVSSAQIAAASGRHHVQKKQVQTSEQFRNANNSIGWPTEAPSSYQGVYSGGWSAPAGN